MSAPLHKGRGARGGTRVNGHGGSASRLFRRRAVTRRLGVLLCLLGLFSGTVPFGEPTAYAASAPAIELIPEVQGVYPSGQGAGFGVEFASDPNGTGLSSFSFTLTPASPTDAQIIGSYCPSGHSCSGGTDPTTGGSTISVSGASIGAPSQLGFFEVKITAPVGQLVPMTVTFTSVTDGSGAALPLPAPVTFNLERGAVLNTVSGSPTTARQITQSDTTAALSYLSSNLSAGADVGQVNPINLASMVPPGSTLPNAPSPNNVVALMQYLNGQRDSYLAQSPPEHVAVTASAPNFVSVNLQLSTPVPGLVLQDVAVDDSSGNSVPITNITTSDGGLSYSLEVSSATTLSYGTTYTVYVGTGTNGTTAIPGLDFASPATFATPQAPPFSESPTVSGVSTGGFTLTMSAGTVPLVAGDLTLRDASGRDVPITSLQTTDTGYTFLVQAPLQAGQTYSLTIAHDGYDFGSALAVSVPSSSVPVTVTITPHVSDLFVQTSPMLPDLPSADVHITDANGNPVGGVSAAPIYGGGTVIWEVYGDVVDSQSYALNLSVPGYQFGSAIPFVMPMGNYVNVTVTPLSSSGFDFTLSQPEAGLTPSDLTVTGPSSSNISVSSLSSSDGGTTYHADASLKVGDTYELQISAPATHANFYSAAFTLPAPVSVKVSGVFDGGFGLQLGSPLALTASSFQLKDSSGNLVTVSSATTTDDLNYKVDAAVTPGQSYTLSITPPLSDETFNPSTPLSFDLPNLTATPSGISSTGFSLTMSLPVPDLTLSDFTLTNTGATTVAATSANTGNGGLTYAIGVPLTVGQSYTLSISDGTSSYGPFGPITLPTVDLSPQVSDITPAGLDVSWGSSEPALTSSDVTLEVAGSGTPIPVNVTWSSTVMQVAPASGSLTPDTTYSLALSSAGYDFGSALTMSEPVVNETPTVENVTTAGFTLALSPALRGLTASDLSLGTGSKLTLGASTDGGATYPVTVASPSLAPGMSTTLTINMQGYAFSSPGVSVAPISVTGAVYGVGTSSLSVSLSPAQPGLDASSVSLTDVTTGQTVPIGSFTTTDGGSTYALSLASGSTFVGQGDSYNLTLTSSRYLLTAPMTFSGLTAATVQVSNISPTGFDITTSPSATLSASDLTLKGNGTAVPIVSVSSGQVDAALSGNVMYAVYVSAPGYVFTDPAPFSLPVTLNTPSNITESGFTLNFDAPVSGLVAGDVEVTQGATSVPVTSLTASNQNQSYSVGLTADALSLGGSYQASVVVPGFDFGPAVTVDVPDLSVTAAVYGVTTGGFDLSLTPADPSLAPGDLSVTTGGTPVAATLGASTDGGSTFPVTATLTSGDTYAISLTQQGYSFNSGANSASAYLPPETVTGSVYDQSTSGFTLGLNPGVNGLSANNLQIAGPNGPVAITGLTTTDQGSTYAVSATLPPDSYTVYLSSTSANLASPLTFTVQPISVTAAVYNASQSGFQVQFSPDLPANQTVTYTLTDNPGNQVSQALETSGSGIQTVLQNLTPGDTYTLAFSLGGYSISGPAAFTVPSSLTSTTAATEAVVLGTAYPQGEVASILYGEGYTADEIAVGMQTAYSLTISQDMVLLEDIGLSGADLPPALYAAFPNETDAEMATLLLGVGYPATSVAAGLESVYHENDVAMASALNQAGASTTDIMEALIDTFGEQPTSMVQALLPLSTPAAAIITALGTVYGEGLDGTASTMEAAGVSATVLVPALETDFGLTYHNHGELAATLEQAGYTAAQAAQGLYGGGVTNADDAVVSLLAAGYGATATAQAAAVAPYSASASEVASDVLPLAPTAAQDLAVLVGAGFTGQGTLVTALYGAGFSATAVAVAIYGEYPSGISTLGPDLTAAGYTFADALTAVNALGSGNDAAAVVASWPTLFGTSGSLATSSAAATNLLAKGYTAAEAAPLLETVYPALSTDAASLAHALLGGGYTAVNVAPVLKAWYLAAGAGGEADLLAGEALGAGGATAADVAATMHTVFGDTASTVVTALETLGLTYSPDIVADLEAGGFGLADVTATALSLANYGVAVASPMMNLAGYSATQTLAAIEAAGDTMDIPHAIAMLASSFPGSGGAYTATDIASALQTVYGADALTVGTDLLGPNLPFGVGDAGAALNTVYGASPQDLIAAVEANGIQPYTILTNSQCRLSLVCTLQTTFGLDATQALQVLHGTGNLSDGTIYNVINAAFSTYGVTTTSDQETALAKAGYSLLEIGSYLNQVDQLSIGSVLSALRQGGYSAAEAASYLKTAYGDSDGGATTALQAAGYSLDDIVIGLESAYSDSSTLFVTLVEYSIATASQASAALASASGTDAALSVAQGMQSYGYDAGQIAQTLSVSFGETPAEIAATLKQAGFSGAETVTGLKTAFDLPAAQAVSILSSVFSITDPTAQAEAMWNGGAYGTYQAADIAGTLGVTDPATLAADMLAAGINTYSVQTALAQVFGPDGAIDNPAALGANLDKLGAASFSEGAAALLLTSYGYNAAQQVALMWAGGYSLGDVSTAAQASIPSSSSNYFNTLEQIFYQVFTCTGGTAGLGACASGTSTFTPTDAAAAYPGASANGADQIAASMAGGGFSLDEIATALESPPFQVPVDPGVYMPGTPTVYDVGIAEALGSAGFTPAQITPLLSQAPFNASDTQIALAYLDSNFAFYVGDVANSLDALPGSSELNAAQAMEDAGYSADSVAEVLDLFGESMAVAYVNLLRLGYSMLDVNNAMIYVYISPDQLLQLAANHS